MPQPGLRPTASGGLAIDGCELGRQPLGSTRLGVDVDPERGSLHVSSSIAHHGDPPLRIVRADRTAPSGQLEPFAQHRKGQHVEHETPHYPVLLARQLDLGGVVGRDVLELAGDGIEAQTTTRARVGDPHRSTATHDTTGRR